MDTHVIEAHFNHFMAQMGLGTTHSQFLMSEHYDMARQLPQQLDRILLDWTGLVPIEGPDTLYRSASGEFFERLLLHARYPAEKQSARAMAINDLILSYACQFEEMDDYRALLAFQHEKDEWFRKGLPDMLWIERFPEEDLVTVGRHIGQMSSNLFAYREKPAIDLSKDLQGCLTCAEPWSRFYNNIVLPEKESIRRELGIIEQAGLLVTVNKEKLLYHLPKEFYDMPLS